MKFLFHRTHDQELGWPIILYNLYYYCYYVITHIYNLAYNISKRDVWEFWRRLRLKVDYRDSRTWESPIIVNIAVH